MENGVWMSKFGEKEAAYQELNMEIDNISSEDVKEATKLINQVPSHVSELIDIIDNLGRRIDNGELDTQNGLSILDLKNLNMLDYITNLTYIMLKKASGESINGDPAINRLVELRVMMEKMRPIEEKLKYEVNKLVASVSHDNIDSNDPLRFRANPDSLDVQEDEDVDDASEEPNKSKAYVPPKISPAFYNEDTVPEQKKKALESARKKALSSSMINELRREFDTGPEEIKEMRDPYRLKISEELKERERFEEEYMMRLPMTKQQRHEMRQLTTVTNFNSNFDDLTTLGMPQDSMQLKRNSSSKKGKFKYRGKKRGSKRKR